MEGEEVRLLKGIESLGGCSSLSCGTGAVGSGGSLQAKYSVSMPCLIWSGQSPDSWANLDLDRI